MKCRVCVLALLTLAGPLQAQSRAWTPTSRALASSTALAILSDWSTTVNMARTHRREGGPGRVFLGSHPQLATVNRVFVLNTLAVGLTAHLVGNKRSPLGLSWRNLFLGSLTVIEGYVGVGHNHLRWGQSFNFRF